VTLDHLAAELERLDASGLRRHPVALDGAQEAEVEIDGRRLVLLCSNNYLGLAADARVRRAAADAAMEWGAGAGASRLVSGTTELHRRLEHALAELKGCEDAVLFSSGYLANLGTIASLVGDGDIVFSDDRNHASIIDGCRLAKARVAIYRHGDAAHLEELLAVTPARRRLVVTDSVFSMDGDLAPLRELAEACERHDAMLMVDEAHATGVLGSSGAGAIEAAALTGRVDVVMGTLSKSLGSAGGFVAGRTELVEWLRNSARTHVFDTAAAPSTVGAALEALGIVRAEPQRRERVRGLATHLASSLRDLGYEVLEPAAAIVPVMVGEARPALELAQRLSERGVFCPAIRPPSVGPGTARIRVTVMATHTDEHIDRVLAAFGDARPRRAATAAPRRPRGVFVTGTDTGVGKTVVAAGLVQAFARSGARVGYAKPVQTGTAEGADDARAAVRLSGVVGVDVCVPAAYPDPLAPSVAARRAGELVDIDGVVSAIEDLRARCDTVVVEGAGGLLVPVDDRTTMAGLIARLGLPVVVVARPSLGTINHTALTVESARARGIHVIGVVVSDFPAHPDAAASTNPSEIERLCGVPLVGVVPHLGDLDVERGLLPSGLESAGWLAPELGGTFDRVSFLSGLEERRLDVASV
jgi:8-amino-7-oxononanoate synthase